MSVVNCMREQGGWGKKGQCLDERKKFFFFLKGRGLMSGC